jgi:hypothetical protein
VLNDSEIRGRLKNVVKPERNLTPLLKAYQERFAGLNCYGK